MAELIDCMERTLAWAKLSLRQVEKRAAEHGGLPRSTLSYTLKHRKKVPTEKQLRAFVFACRIDNHWESWRMTRKEIEYEAGRGRRSSARVPVFKMLR